MNVCFFWLFLSSTRILPESSRVMLNRFDFCGVHGRKRSESACQQFTITMAKLISHLELTGMHLPVVWCRRRPEVPTWV